MEVAVSESRRMDSEDARRERKRAHDRRAQRIARERNKNRIAQLEATVAALRNQRCDECGTGVIAQLDMVTPERDQLAATLSSIETAIQGYKDRFGGKLVRTQVKETPKIAQALNVQALGQGKHQQDPDISASELETDLILHDNSVFDQSFDAMSSVSADGWPESMLFSPDAVFPTDDLILPRPESLCDCAPAFCGTEPSQNRKNIWRSANAILREEHDQTKAMLRYEEACSENIAVRVVLEGWDSVEKDTELPLMWRKLRKIDDLQFSNCPDTERLAILFTMHLILRFHADPSAEQQSRLPDWLQKR